MSKFERLNLNFEYEPINWNKLLSDIKNKLTNSPIDCKQEIENDVRLKSEVNRVEIVNIIKKFIDNKDVNVAVLFNRKTLKELGNTINVKIFNKDKSYKEIFSVVLYNLIKKLDEDKIKALKSFSLKQLLGIDPLIIDNEESILERCQKYRVVLHPDKPNYEFFHPWWKWVKNLDLAKESFNKVYSSFQKEVFKKLSKEWETVEAIFKKLDTYNFEILNDSEDVNQFSRYLITIYNMVDEKCRVFKKAQKKQEQKQKQ